VAAEAATRAWRAPAKNFGDLHHAVFSRTDFRRRADGHCHQAVVRNHQHLPITAHGAAPRR
jgi:hypothetical protein